MASLSSHLGKLEEAGLVELHKHFVGKKPVTSVRLAEDGREATEAYWNDLALVETMSRPPTASQGSPKSVDSHP